MTLKFRVLPACRIANINRNRFNEAVAAGNYPCAPAVARGSTRVFDEVDLIVLYFYARLSDQCDDFSPSLAGKLACYLAEVLKENPDEDEVVIVRSIAGGYEAFAASKMEGAARNNWAGSALFRFTADVANVRKLVKKEIEEELKIIGEED